MIIRAWEGKPISEPGIYKDVPIDVYHGPNLCTGPSVSSTGLRAIFWKSAFHYWAYSPYNPKRFFRPETEAMLLGRATHHMLLGEKGFWEIYVERPETYMGKKWHGARTECGEWLLEQREKNLTVLTGANLDAIRGMALGLAEDPLVQAGMLSGMIEHTIVDIDRETGIFLKVRPDAIPNDSGDYGDLKTTTAVDDDSLQRTIEDYAYNMQGGLIGQLSQNVLALPMSSFNLAFVESKEPHCARTISVDSYDLALGHEQNQIAIQTFARGMKTGVWLKPGGTRSDGAKIGLKKWAHDNIGWRISEMKRELEF